LLIIPVSPFHSRCDLSISVMVAIRWKFGFPLVASDSGSRNAASSGRRLEYSNSAIFLFFKCYHFACNGKCIV
jgi:hypothetical protein